ncbi:response regulator [Bowmanella sp. Y26]|uniref:ATP-binding protein n=1 Tax=Bowmanella yangjiangensis TaxID=2811230 RepID=UPI001BDD332C|nr:ATP-binding protein [Bowmanella yangjiangensis]MBT1066150.1 response regulator [Bowmanella yangjiangensis]
MNKKTVPALKSSVLTSYFLPISLVIVVSTSILMTAFFESRLADEIAEETDQQLTQSLALTANSINDALEQYRKDLFFLHATPPISGLARATENNGLDPLDGTRLEQWKFRLSTIFKALMQNRTEIAQLRIISTENSGLEIVRVDRIAGTLEVIPPERLQNKSDSDYFKEIKGSSPGQVYISNISLNREYGKIEFPYRPMIRLGLPIFYNSGAQFGFLIININATSIISRLSEHSSRNELIMLLDSKGRFVYHPDETLQYSKDLNPELTVDSLYSIDVSGRGTKGTLVSKDNESAFSFMQKDIRIGASQDDGVLRLVIGLSQERIHQLMMQERISSYGFVFVLSGILLTILLILNGKIRSQIRLSETMAETEAIVNGVSDAIFSLDLERKVRAWNNSAERLFGLAAFNILGTELRELSIFNNSDVTEAINETMEKKTINIVEYHLQTTTGLIDAKVSIYPIITSVGILRGVAITIEDISAQKMIEMKNELAKAELEKLVNERTAELAIAHQKAVQASEVKSAFISNVSHEMRTPLNGIIGTIQLLKRDPMTGRQKKYLAMTESSTLTLATLINDILDLSKIEAGKLEIDIAPFSLVHMLESLADSMAIKAQERGLEFILDLSNLHVDEVRSDILRLKQILTNLLSNASKFTDHGFVKLTVFDKSDAEEQTRLYFEVQDSGVGIADENKHKIFGAFSQEHTGVTEQYGGTGLGLSICKQLCHLLNGEIEFESKKGEGSCFRFYITLPVTPSQTEHLSFALSGQHIAVFVKHPILRDVIQRTLTKLGGVCCLPEGIEGIRQTLEEADMCIIEPDYTDWAKITDSSFRDDLECFLLLDPLSVEDISFTANHRVLNKPFSQTELLEKLAGKKSDQIRASNTLSANDTTLSLKGHTILIVDDNHINVEVAKGLIEPTLARTLVANTGEEALQVLRDNPFVDCILMDCQMPILDGFETTKKIRSGEAGEQCIKIPILAMTASAMSGEREKCISSGMNDYITKPISASILEAKLSKWSVKIKSFQTHSVVEDPEHPIWDKQSALTRMQNNHILFNKVVRMFIDYSAEKVGALNIAVEMQDAEAVRKAAHAFRGLAGDIGASMLAFELNNLENAAKKGNIELFTSALAKIQSSYNSLMEELSRFELTEAS